jgi:hypothetical protein
MLPDRPTRVCWRSLSASSRRVIRRGAVLTFAAVALVAVTAPTSLGGPARALVQCSTQTQNGHCYGYAKWVGTQNYGGFVNTSAIPFQLPSNPCSNILTQEQWVGTGDDSTPAYFVEQGYFIGQHLNGTCSTSPVWFWIEIKPGAPPSQHFPNTSANLSQNYQIKIFRVASATWDVYKDGFRLGTSTNNPGPSRFLAAGLETTSPNAVEAGAAGSMKRLSLSLNWLDTWPGATTQANPPAQAGWNTQYQAMWDQINCC